jgi:ketosteroid isomerase-like protein
MGADEHHEGALAELVRGFWASAQSHDWDAILPFFADDVAWDLAPVGLSVFRGKEQLRAHWEEWMRGYDELEFDAAARELGGGLVLAEIHQRGYPVGSGALVETQQTYLYRWVDGIVVRVTLYPHTDEARAAAERLAKERIDA